MFLESIFSCLYCLSLVCFCMAGLMTLVVHFHALWFNPFQCISKTVPGYYCRKMFLEKTKEKGFFWMLKDAWNLDWMSTKEDCTMSIFFTFFLIQSIVFYVLAHLSTCWDGRVCVLSSWEMEKRVTSWAPETELIHEVIDICTWPMGF